MNDKGIYQPWSHEEFMADRRVRRMTPTAVKTYMMLLHEAYFCSTRPYLPDDEGELELMAYCESTEEWQLVREAVLGMFERKEVDGVKVLSNKRLERDWEHLQEIRGVRSEAGRKGGLAKAKQMLGSTKQNVASKEVSKEVREEKEVNETAPDSFENDGQGDGMNLKPLKASMTAIARKYKATLGGFDNTWADIKLLADEYGSGVLLSDFEEFMKQKQGDDFYKGAAVAYQYAAPYRLAEEAATADATDPEVVSLARELSYLSEGQISFMDKQRVRLAEVLKEFSAAEITSAFSAWYADQDTNDPKNVSFLAGKFVQIVDGLAYAARKTKKQKEQYNAARDATAKRMSEEAEAARQAQAKKEAEQDFDPFA
jgi:hypothetical protein